MNFNVVDVTGPNLTPPHFCAWPEPEHDIPTPYDWSISVQWVEVSDGC